MIHNMPAPVARQTPHVAEGSELGTTDDSHGLLQQIHHVLRGRYRWVALLTILGAALGAVGGWYAAGEPKIRSTGVVHIRPILPKVMYDTEQTRIMPMFDSFVASQVELMRSRRVIDAAMQEDEWKNAGAERKLWEMDEFRELLNISRIGGGDMIRIRFDHTQRAVAVAAVRSLIVAYEDHYRERYSRSETKRLEILEERQASLRNELNSYRESIKLIGDQYGSDVLGAMHEFKVQEMQGVESQLRKVQTELALLAEEEVQQVERDGSAEAAEAVTDDASQEPSDLTLNQIAAQDLKMTRLLAEKHRIENDIKFLSITLAPKHATIRPLEVRLQILEVDIQEYAQEFRDAYVENGSSSLSLTPEQRLTLQKTKLMALYGELKDEAKRLGQNQLRIQRLKELAATAEQRLADTRNRIDLLTVETFSQVDGRIDVISNGDDTTQLTGVRARLATAGGVGGALLGIGVMALIGLFDPRYRSPFNASHDLGVLRLLGVLPELPHDQVDIHQSRLAARNLHAVRAILQLGVERHEQRVLTITSPAPGEGKTSLTLALGFSFAATGQSVLLIDADLTIGSLSRRANAIVRRKIGQIILREGLVGDEHLEEALKLARQSGRRVGDVLVERRRVSREQVESASDAQLTNHLGFVEALEGEPLEQCVTEIGVPGLYLLPIGSATAVDADRISPDRLRRLLDQARARFDVVLIDTGPILAGPEACLIAAASDSTVFVIARGGRRALLKRALQLNRQVGTHVSGLVFNRMAQREFTAYGSSSSGISSTMRDESLERNAETHGNQTDFGPIAQTVSASSKS